MQSESSPQTIEDSLREYILCDVVARPRSRLCIPFGMKKLTRLASALSCALSIYLLLPAVASAQTIVQLTNSVELGPVDPQGRTASITTDGSKIAFVAIASGPPFPFHVFTMNSDGTGLTQITDFPVEPSVGASNEPPAVISGDGSKIVFVSTSDPLGTNPDGGRELFIINSDRTDLVQLTSSSAFGEFFGFSLSANGSKVAFTSVADYLGTNPDGSREIYIINSDGTGLTQLTNFSFRQSFSPSISADGTKIVFNSNADPFGTNPSNQVALFVINTDGTGLIQLPSVFCAGTGCFPTISGDGSKIAFASAGDPLGTNPDEGQQIFTINSDGTGLAQLTFGTGDTEPALISIDGSKIAFGWNGDPMGTNPVDFLLDPPQRYRQVFVINSDGTGLLQLTNARDLINNIPASNFPSGISSDGSTIVFTSNANFVGTNSDGNFEIFLVTLVTNTPVGTDVVVQPTDITTGTTPATLTFSNVTQPGITTLITNNSGPEPPSGFKLGDPAIYYGLATNALFSGPITVCIDYTGTEFGDESQLKLFHFEGGIWVDRTVSLDMTNNIICASVNTLSPFAIFEPANQPPVADAGVDQVVECGNHAGTAVTLDGSGSSDADGDPLNFTWNGPFGVLTGQTVSTTLPLGTHVISLTVDDGKGGTASDSVLVTVQDTTPPALTVSLSPSILWPPNHKLVQIGASIQVDDLCDANPGIALVLVSSNEPDNGLGDGDTPNDIQGASFGTDDRSFFLRAERAGNGTGRIYTVVYRTMDASGNMTSGTAQVTVPHDRRKP